MCFVMANAAAFLHATSSADCLLFVSLIMVIVTAAHIHVVFLMMAIAATFIPVMSLIMVAAGACIHDILL